MKPTWWNGKEYGSPQISPHCIRDQSGNLLYSKRRIIFAGDGRRCAAALPVPTQRCEASQLRNDYLKCLTWWHFGLFKLKELALQQTPAHVENPPFIFRKRRHTKGLLCLRAPVYSAPLLVPQNCIHEYNHKCLMWVLFQKRPAPLGSANVFPVCIRDAVLHACVVQTDW